MIGLGAIVALGALAVHNTRSQEGKTICVALTRLTTAEQAERLNAADDIRPSRLSAGVTDHPMLLNAPRQPLSIDDYCGVQCRPGSLGWNACLDSCRNYCK
jgi:hypothetical protein